MIQCPTCGAGLRFDVASQQMVCDYCHNHFDPTQITDNSTRDDAKTQPYFDSYVYICPSCGAELVTTDKNDAIGFCQYCGGASMIFDKIRREWKPDRVVPFKVTKEQCKDLYLKEVKKNPFIGGKYRNPQTIDSFRGIYMPYWSYDAAIVGEFSLRGVSSRQHVSGNTYHIYHYDMRSNTDYTLSGFSHDASITFDDDLSETIAPFEQEGTVAFSPAYLSGFYAEIGNVDPHEYDEEIIKEVVAGAEKAYSESPAIQGAMNSNSLHISSGKSKFPAKIKSVSRTMNPVWFMSCRNKDTITYAAVNGQTGKVAADLPLSPIRILVAALGISAVIFGVLFLAMSVLPSIKANMTLAICTVLTLFGVHSMINSFNNTVDKNGSVLDQSTNKFFKGGTFAFMTVISFAAILFISFDGSAGGTLRGVSKIALAVTCVYMLIATIIQFADSSKIKKMKIDIGSQLRQRIAESARKFLNGVLWLRILMLISIAASIIIVVVDPAYNIVSYAACVVLAVELFGFALYNIAFQTNVAKRPLPQFNKKGARYDSN